MKERVTRRAFLAQGATAAVGASMSNSAKAGVLTAASQGNATQPGSLERRQRYLEKFRQIFLPGGVPSSGRINRLDKTWEAWVTRTGALPPDFATMPSIPELPDPLLLREGERSIPVTTHALWERQRRWVLSQAQHWIFGSMPPKPDNLRAVVTSTQREGTTTVRNVRLEFGPDHRAVLHLELILPPGAGPFPVFLTNHPRFRPWVATAVRRGYLACIYHGADPLETGYPDDSEAFLDIYPDYDFSCLARWAWAGSRAVDYLMTLPDVDKTRVGITGHSRNGKQALVAAAFDERITAAAPSSGNTGECNPWRYTTDMFVNESIEEITGNFPQWFHPRLRWFAGQEDKLPLDQNMLMATVAPRGLMLHAGYAESQGNPLGFEQCYRSVLSAYRFVGHEERLWLQLRDGEHEFGVPDVENIVDFFDATFGRKPFPKREVWTLGYTFENWKHITGEQIEPMSYPKRETGDFLKTENGQTIASTEQWEEKKKLIRQHILEILGDAPAQLPFPSPHTLSFHSECTDGWLASIYGRPGKDHWGGYGDRLAGQRLREKGIDALGLPFGNELFGNLFFPLDSTGQPKPGKLPVVIWLHPHCYQNGWSGGDPWASERWAYSQDERSMFPLLWKKGFAVFGFDQVGYGARIHAARNFYNRYPHWSTMGNMIEDTRAAIDALAALEEIDASRIYLMGYSLGGKIALLTAAFDDRPAGIVSICGFDPLRLQTPEKGTEGIPHYSHLHGLLPRLGFFLGHEDRLPFDFDEVLALAAPKPTLLIAPELDRYARVEDVKREVGAAKKVYDLLGRGSALQFETPMGIHRYPRNLQEHAADWLGQRTA